MFKIVKKQMLGLFNAFGYNLLRCPPAFAPDEIAIIATVRPCTMTHDLQICGPIDAVRLDFRPLLNRLDYIARLAIKPAL